MQTGSMPTVELTARQREYDGAVLAGIRKGVVIADPIAFDGPVQYLSMAGGEFICLRAGKEAIKAFLEGLAISSSTADGSLFNEVQFLVEFSGFVDEFLKDPSMKLIWRTRDAFPAYLPYVRLRDWAIVEDVVLPKAAFDPDQTIPPDL